MVVCVQSSLDGEVVVEGVGGNCGGGWGGWRGMGDDGGVGACWEERGGVARGLEGEIIIVGEDFSVGGDGGEGGKDDDSGVGELFDDGVGEEWGWAFVGEGGW